ncbi:MAG: hypothetical protein WCF27_01620 [Gaiellaceae bacterium]
MTEVIDANPGLGLASRTAAPRNERRVGGQSTLLVVTTVPQVSAVVFAPDSVTVPLIPLIDTGKMRPPRSLTVIGAFDRNVAVRLPSEIAERLQPPSATGGAV